MWRPSLYSFNFFDSPIESNPLTACFIYLFIHLVLIFLPIIRCCFFSVLVFLLSIFYLLYFLFLGFIQFSLFLFYPLSLNYLVFLSCLYLVFFSYLSLLVSIIFLQLFIFLLSSLCTLRCAVAGTALHPASSASGQDCVCREAAHQK